MDHIDEVARINPKQLTAKSSQRYWALYASFYEKLFQKIDDISILQDEYKSRIRSKELNGEAKDALTFFYRIRRDELNDPNFWNKVRENKGESMKNLVNESIDNYLKEME